MLWGRSENDRVVRLLAIDSVYADKMRKQIVAETIGWARDIYVFQTTGSLPDRTLARSLLDPTNYGTEERLDPPAMEATADEATEATTDEATEATTDEAMEVTTAEATEAMNATTEEVTDRQDFLTASGVSAEVPTEEVAGHERAPEAQRSPVTGDVETTVTSGRPQNAWCPSGTGV